MTKEPFKYFCIAILVCFIAHWGYKTYFPTTYVYLEDGTNIFHKTEVCDQIQGLHVMEELGEVIRSKKIDEKEVFYNKKYEMCNYCFSPMEIEYRTKYINRSLK